MHTRIKAAISGAVVALAAATAMFNGSPGATADQGEPVIAGQANSATETTFLFSSDVCLDYKRFGGLGGCGATVGVEGSTATGTAVYGHNTGSTGIGVHGLTGGTGSAVFGQATGSGVGVFGDTTDGTGVIARSTNGHALDVRGKAKFSRSGTATVNGTSATPRSSVTVNGVALTAKSLVLVTPQKNVPGVWVQAAVPNRPNSRFTVFLNKNVSVSYPVAWMVIEKP
jgi:hypothetical protein